MGAAGERWYRSLCGLISFSNFNRVFAFFFCSSYSRCFLIFVFFGKYCSALSAFALAFSAFCSNFATRSKGILPEGACSDFSGFPSDCPGAVCFLSAPVCPVFAAPEPSVCFSDSSKTSRYCRFPLACGVCSVLSLPEVCTRSKGLLLSLSADTLEKSTSAFFSNSALLSCTASRIL